MSDKKYDDNDLQRLGEVIAEQLISDFRTGLEALTTIKQQVSKIPKLEADLGTLESDMSTVKAAVKATNNAVKKLEKTTGKLEDAVKTNSKDIQSLDKAVGKTEHRVDLALKFSELANHEARRSRKAEKQQPEDHEERLLRLEIA